MLRHKLDQVSLILALLFTNFKFMTDKIDYISFLKENRTIEQARDIYDLRISDSRIVFDRFSKDFYERTCPVCGSEEQINLAKFDDRYDISQCKKCLTRYVNPAPTLRP